MAMLLGRIASVLAAGGKMVAASAARAALVARLTPILQASKITLREATSLHQTQLQAGKRMVQLNQPRYMYQVENGAAPTRWIVQIEEAGAELIVEIQKNFSPLLKNVMETTSMQDRLLFEALQRAFTQVGLAVKHLDQLT